jgi:nucleotide-binding universal stress UspA family protein
MTAFKTILVPLDDAALAAPPLSVAFRLADRFAAHVTALHVKPDPTLVVPLVGEGMSGAMVEEMLSMAERQAAERAAEIKAVYDAQCQAHDVVAAQVPPAATATTAWLERTGREEEQIAWLGRLADVIVMARPADPAEATGQALNAALMDSGRPLLVAPPGDGPATIGDHVAIAWNGSAEAAQAVAHAMPLLAQAKTVTILTAPEHHRHTGAADELAQSLAWHGIETTVRPIADMSHAGPALLAECQAVGADLLVMGAYSHSRLRQMILGGVTRHVLGHAVLPVFMCH